MFCLHFTLQKNKREKVEPSPHPLQGKCSKLLESALCHQMHPSDLVRTNPKNLSGFFIFLKAKMSLFNSFMAFIIGNRARRHNDFEKAPSNVKLCVYISKLWPKLRWSNGSRSEVAYCGMRYNLKFFIPSGDF